MLLTRFRTSEYLILLSCSLAIICVLVCSLLLQLCVFSLTLVRRYNPQFFRFFFARITTTQKPFFCAHIVYLTTHPFDALRLLRGVTSIVEIDCSLRTILDDLPIIVVWSCDVYTNHRSRFELTSEITGWLTVSFHPFKGL